jgi:hypothetical protein
MSDEITDQDIDKMQDAELEFQEIESRKTPRQKLIELLEVQQKVLNRLRVILNEIEDL